MPFPKPYTENEKAGMKKMPPKKAKKPVMSYGFAKKGK